ncbi:MAG: hypothetical protein LBU42_08060 [Prevotellaceae bacterium]|nr:hypothetical protein [Prevotellaceae bacterium]
MRVERSETQHGDARRYSLHPRGAPAFRYALTVRRAKDRGVLRSAGCAALACGYEYPAPSGRSVGSRQFIIHNS